VGYSYPQPSSQYFSIGQSIATHHAGSCSGYPAGIVVLDQTVCGRRTRHRPIQHHRGRYPPDARHVDSRPLSSALFSLPSSASPLSHRLRSGSLRPMPNRMIVRCSRRTRPITRPGRIHNSRHLGIFPPKNQPEPVRGRRLRQCLVSSSGQIRRLPHPLPRRFPS
jgi:hypothetical protein